MDAYVQPPPGPWDIPAKTPNFFVDGKQIIKVPYTSSVKVNFKIVTVMQNMFGKKIILWLPVEIFPHEKHFICRLAILVWEWGENLAKNVLVLEM